MVILTLFSDNISFIQICITLQQVRTHQLSYINAILIQSWGVLISDSCTDCQKYSMTLFWNVIIHQNISMSIVITVSDLITLLTALYTTMMYSLSSQTMRMMTVSMRVSALLNWGRLHWLCCQWEQSLLTLRFRYVWLFFLFLCCL